MNMCRSPNRVVICMICCSFLIFWICFGGASDLVLTADKTQWECIAYCLSQLTYTEKGMKKLMESFKTYEHVLLEDSVVDHFKNIISKVINYYFSVYIHKLVCWSAHYSFLFSILY